MRMRLTERLWAGLVAVAVAMFMAVPGAEAQDAKPGKKADARMMKTPRQVPQGAATLMVENRFTTDVKVFTLAPDGAEVPIGEIANDKKRSFQIPARVIKPGRAIELRVYEQAEGWPPPLEVQMWTSEPVMVQPGEVVALAVAPNLSETRVVPELKSQASH